MTATVVCSNCGRETEQTVEVGSVYMLRCPCRHPELDGVELVEHVLSEDEPQEELVDASE